MTTHQSPCKSCPKVALVILAALPLLAGAAGETHEKPPIQLAATDFVPAKVLAGEDYTVRKAVSNDGIQNTYTVDTPYGVQTVTGTQELYARLREVTATRALEKLEDSEEFKNAAKGSVEGMVEGGKSLIEAPVDTAKGAAKGVGRWLGNVGKSINSDDPYQDNALETATGYDAVKRIYALNMGVDPYTEFKPFQEHLSEVARAATAGNMVTSAAINLGTSGTLLGTVAGVSKLASMKKILQDNPPAALVKINREKLMQMGIQDHHADALLKNYNYTPAEMTLMCEALHSMGDVSGRDIFVSYATSAPDRQVANFMQHYAELLADYLENVESGRIVNTAGSAWLLSDSGSLVGVFPIDYLAWTRSVEQDTTTATGEMAKLGAKRKEVLVQGRISPTARAALEKRGWKLTENVKFTETGQE